MAMETAWAQSLFWKASRHAWKFKKLGLVTQPLLVPVRLHAFAALVFGDFGFAAFFN
jgi:hypothetical protein